MGLLDWSPAGNDSTEDLSFPNFNAWGPSSSFQSQADAKPSNTRTNSAFSSRLDSTRYNNSSTSLSSPRSSFTNGRMEAFPSIAVPVGMDSATNSSAESMASSLYVPGNSNDALHLSAPQPESSSKNSDNNLKSNPDLSGSTKGRSGSVGRGRSPSFDLFGDDEELQEAESRIGFCDICLRQCQVHAVD